jgi:hypothetical protein
VIIVAVCSKTQIALSALNEDTGAIVRQVIITLPPNTQTTYGCADGTAAFRQMFNQDYSRLAVTIADPADGSHRIGYIDLATQQLVNLEPKQPGSFQAAPQHTSAVYGPVSDKVFFTSNGTRALFGAIDTCSRTVGGTTLLESNPARTVQAMPIGCGWAIWDPGQKITNGIILSRDGVDTLMFDTYDLFPQATSATPGRLGLPLRWIDETRLIVRYDTTRSGSVGPNTFLVVTFSPDLRAITGFSLLLPNSDRQNSSPVLAPDRSRLAFLSVQGKTSGLYVMTLPAAGATPAPPQVLLEPADVPLIVDWR